MSLTQQKSCLSGESVIWRRLIGSLSQVGWRGISQKMVFIVEVGKKR